MDDQFSEQIKNLILQEQKLKDLIDQTTCSITGYIPQMIHTPWENESNILPFKKHLETKNPNHMIKSKYYNKKSPTDPNNKLHKHVA